ncbi:MAG TPA: ABC transporter ATP-binding protein [Acidimicrobiia bacterium]|jgi:simple sugar transport system ATP-binding protein|nr:ABC transporter ATP-binding protein [Acidimicrobiia bacterium]HIL46896.1 ABC transporter ATP-binding protein [Acidimicrobiia bacterium]
MNENQTTPALEAISVTKRFGPIVANENVDFRVEKGQIHALLGENGAGKSTLVNILFGLYHADEGEILIDGEKVAMNSPHDAIDRHIGMVHQHFQLVPVLSVTENIVLGHEPTKKRGILDLEKAYAEVEALGKRYGLEVDPRAIVEDLPIGTQQRVEILRSLYRKADVLILDEPTAVLTPQETDHLLEVLRGLAAEGVAIIFITHKLREVMAVADHVTVMRRGKVVGAIDPSETDQAGLAEMMVGRSVVLRIAKGEANVGAPVLTVDSLKALDDRSQTAVDGLCLTVHAGEIFGIAGVEGNGQRELVEAITGLRQTISGSIMLEDTELAGCNPREISEQGVAHVPEDREKHGLVGPHSVADNLVLNRYFKAPFARRGVRQIGAINEDAQKLVDQYDVRTASINSPVRTLSGGNKQKVIAAREFSQNAKFLVAAQPTRGIDVGSIEFVHQQLVDQRDDGIAVLLVSAELDEIMSLSDRIGVIYQGRLVAVGNAEDFTRNQIGQLMASGSADA